MKIRRAKLLAVSNIEYYMATDESQEDLEEAGYDYYKMAESAYELAKKYFNVLRDKELYEIAIADNAVIGASFTSTDSNNYSFDVVVHPNYRRQGIAKKLIDSCISEYHFSKDAFPKLTFQVDVVNPDLEIYLKKLGFKVVQKDSRITVMKYGKKK